MSREATAPGCTRLGLDVGGTKVRIVVGDSAGAPVFTTVTPTQDDVPVQLSYLIHRYGGNGLRSVGIGVPGAVHPDTGVVSQAPNVPSIDGLDLGGCISAGLGILVSVSNDVTAAALAEHHLGGHRVDTLAVIAAGTGVGLGLVHEGQVVKGAHGAAGEIANLPLAGAGALEDTVSVRGLQKAYGARGGCPSAAVPDILARATRNEPIALSAVREYADGLARGIEMVCAVVDPGRVVLTGGLGYRPLVHRLVIESIRRPELRDLVVRSPLGEEAPALGAMLLGTLPTSAASPKP